MKIKKEKFHIFPHVTVSIWLHLMVFLVFILLAEILGRENGAEFERARLILFIVYPICFLGMVLLLNVFFWNAVVTLDSKGMRQRQGRKVYVWRWDEVLNVTCKTKRPWLFRSGQAAVLAPKFKIISSAHGRKLTIVMEKYTRNAFFQICPNEALCQKCRDLLADCNFSYI